MTGAGRFRRRVQAGLGLLLLPALAAAHPIHASVAEADYNRATGRLELAVRVFADDFEAALTARAGRKISLEKSPAAEIETLARAYVAERFTVRTRAGERTVLAWIGRDLKDAANELWLFFEIALPGGVEGARIHHALLNDQFRDQLNSVNLRDGARKATLVFLPNHPEKLVKLGP